MSRAQSTYIGFAASKSRNVHVIAFAHRVSQYREVCQAHKHTEFDSVTLTNSMCCGFFIGSFSENGAICA